MNPVASICVPGVPRPLLLRTPRSRRIPKTVRVLLSIAQVAFAIVIAPSVASAESEPALHVVSGVTRTGAATDLWLEILKKRLPAERYEAIAPLLKPLTAEEGGWAELIRSRAGEWQNAIPAVAREYRPVSPPADVLIVLGNRGADDAFTHDPTTIGFDLSALQSVYGDARLPGNSEKIDRFFRHEYVHLMQKAWVSEHPWSADTPLRAALADIWREGLGNYESLSPRWKSRSGRPSAAARRALSELEPRLVARLAALSCAAPESAAALSADLSRGRFDEKWGALTAALWIEEEDAQAAGARRAFILAGPEGVWDLALRHLPEELSAALKEARLAERLCRPESGSLKSPQGID